MTDNQILNAKRTGWAGGMYFAFGVTWQWTFVNRTSSTNTGHVQAGVWGDGPRQFQRWALSACSATSTHKDRVRK